MKKVNCFWAVFVAGLVILGSCSKNENVVIPVIKDSLAGRVWTITEDAVTSVVSFIDDTQITVTETSAPASAPAVVTRATATYVGTYTYNKSAGTAVLNYNNRSRQLTEIQFGEGVVSFRIDGVPVTVVEVTPPDPTNDKEFLDKTAREFVGMFNSGQTANYASIYNAVRNTKGGEAGEKIEDIIDGLTTRTETTNLTIYKYAIKAAAFKGRYVLRNGSWFLENGNGHSAVFFDDMGRLCELTVTMSGLTKKVIVYEEKDNFYDWYYGTFNEEDYIYEAEIPSHIECVLTQGGSQLVKLVCDFDLNSIVEGQRVNVSRNSLSFTCVADLRDVAKITTTARYVAQGTSAVSIIVEKNGRRILTAEAASQSNLQTQAPEEWDEDDVERISNTVLNLNILDKVQIKGSCSNINELVQTLDRADSDRNRYNYEAVKQYVDLANNLIQAKAYYNNTATVRATLRFDVDHREDYYYGYGDSQTRYYPVASIQFADGSSFFVSNYFTEDAFRVLVDMVADLKDDVESQFD